MSYGRTPYYIFDRGCGVGVYIIGPGLRDADNNEVTGVILPYAALAQFMLHIVSCGAIKDQFLAYLKLALIAPDEWITTQKTIAALEEIADAAKAGALEREDPKGGYVLATLRKMGALHGTPGKPILWSCPVCGVRVAFDSAEAARALLMKCPECRTPFTLPEDSEGGNTN